MANKNKGKQVGEPCAYCNILLVAGQWGAWCPPCNDKWKASKSQGGKAPAKSSGGYGKKLADYKAMVLRYAVDKGIAEKKDMDSILKDADKMITWFKGEPKKSLPTEQSTFESPIDDTDDIPF